MFLLPSKEESNLVNSTPPASGINPWSDPKRRALRKQAGPRVVKLNDASFKYLFLLSAVAASLCVGFKPANRITAPPQVDPEALVVLGGHEERERYAAKLALQHPELPIWLSSGSPKEYAQLIFANAGVKSDRLNFDYAASDTVTNFTTLVDRLKAEGIDRVYLITSENHMQRAIVIGDIVFRSRGITFEPIPVPSENPPEPIEKSIRDGARAMFWLVTGSTGQIVLKYRQRCLELL